MLLIIKNKVQIIKCGERDVIEIKAGHLYLQMI